MLEVAAIILGLANLGVFVCEERSPIIWWCLFVGLMLIGLAALEIVLEAPTIQ